ncbi:hypothetical protein HMN09_00377600 [Mycena chlorophos]|uniref:F-box domain-containing protein n=1 Tax=Mycena chlorophos TaxID=658473 RepID=A0A8H6TJG5_MYCCL|nr:hypothetical protein HMN09_00377600 [Mycena chlorophos]
MHRVLETPELVDLICTELRLGESWEDSNALANLAQTNTQFRDVALDALWYEQDGIQNLLALLPDGIATLLDGPGAKVIFSRPLEPADIIPLVPYLHRIRVLFCQMHAQIFQRSSASHISADVLHAYDAFTNYCERHAPSGRKLFPNLRTLTWTPAEHFGPDSKCRIRFLETFGGPHLTSLTLGGCRETTLQSALHHPAVLRQLHSLMVELPPLPRTQTQPGLDTTSQVIQELRDIRDLNTPIMNARALHHLTQLPSLAQLWLTWPRSGPSVVLPPHTRLVFPELAVLGMEQLGHQPEGSTFFADIVRAAELPKLVAFTLQTEVRCSAEFLDEVLGTFASHHSATAPRFRSFFLINEGPLDTPSRPPGISLTALRHLYPFTRLVDLNMEITATLDLDDVFLAELSAAWPLLERLVLTRWNRKYRTLTWHQSAPRPGVTLLGLQSLARNCPRLINLTISVDSTRPDTESWTDDLLRYHVPETVHPLCTFNAADSPITNSFAVAWFLAMTFPKLGAVGTDNIAEDFPDDEFGMDDDDDPVELAEMVRLDKLFRGYARRWNALGKLLSQIDEVVRLGVHSYPHMASILRMGHGLWHTSGERMQDGVPGVVAASGDA